MNSNLFHNIVNVTMIAVAGVTAVLVAMGCTTLTNGDLRCEETMFLSPGVATMIVTGLGITKMIVNVVRDGVTGLTKPQPPVKK